jgi:hypothetical protein
MRALGYVEVILIFTIVELILHANTSTNVASHVFCRHTPFVQLWALAVITE